MPESLEAYLQQLLKQALEKKALPPKPTPRVEAEVIDLVEVPAPVQPQAPRAQSLSNVSQSDASRTEARGRETEGASAAELRVGADRPLGNLGATTSDAETAATLRAKTIVDEIVALLHSPGGVQKALVLSEILQRPEERW